MVGSSRLLLDTSFSDDLSLGGVERFFSLDSPVLSRVVCYTPFVDQDTFGVMARFFGTYGFDVRRVEGLESKLAKEYVLDRFVDDLKGKGVFDEVEYVCGSPGSSLHASNRRFMFLHDGRTIKASRVGEPYKNESEICRLVRLGRNGRSQYLVLDPGCTNGSKKKKRSLQFSAAYDFLEGTGLDSSVLSYMLMVPRTVFDEMVSENSSLEAVEAVASRFLYGDNDLLLVTSFDNNDFKQMGQEALGTMNYLGL